MAKVTDGSGHPTSSQSSSGVDERMGSGVNYAKLGEARDRRVPYYVFLLTNSVVTSPQLQSESVLVIGTKSNPFRARKTLCLGATPARASV